MQEVHPQVYMQVYNVWGLKVDMLLAASSDLLSVCVCVCISFKLN